MASETEICFSPDKTSNLPYPQSFFFDEAQGQVTLDASFELRDKMIFRKVDRWLSGRPHANMRGWISGWLAHTWQDLGIEASEVMLHNEGFQFPATETRHGDTWVILVHGRTAKRAETYRAFKIFSDLGLSCLAISLRNNFEATTTKKRRSHFGAVEWQDVATAVDYAEFQGAKRIIFYAISMGAVSVAECIRNHNVQPVAVILDSPVVSWRETLDVMANENKLNSKQRKTALWFIESKIGSKLLGLSQPVSLHKIGFQNWSQKFEIPFLLMHSRDDGYVDYEPSARFAHQHLEYVNLETFDTALHVQLWNYQPERYRRLITDFLAQLPT